MQSGASAEPEGQQQVNEKQKQQNYSYDVGILQITNWATGEIGHGANKSGQVLARDGAKRRLSESICAAV